MAYTDCIIHDADALSDTKIQRLIASKGCSAYAVYWAILESMRKNEGNFSLEDCDIIAHQLWSSADIVIDIVNACVEFGLFIRGDDNSLQSVRLNEDIANVKRKREEFSKGGKKRWRNTENEPSLSLAQAKHEPSLSLAKHARAFSCSSSSSSSCSSSSSSSCSSSSSDIKNPSCNQEEKKADEATSALPLSTKTQEDASLTQEPKKQANFKPPTVDEIRKYITETKSSVDAQVFFDFYESKGWVVGKTKMKDWKACLRTWNKRELQGVKRPAGYMPSWNKEEDDKYEF